MRLSRIFVLLAAIGFAIVLPANPASAAGRCQLSGGIVGPATNTCTIPIKCDAPTVTVTVQVSGPGTVTGSAQCAPAPPATCSATGVPLGTGTCTATAPAALGGFLACSATVTGAPISWTVTCSNP